MLWAFGAAAHHNPPPLADPIPGTISTGPFTVELASRVATLEFPTNVAASPDGTGRWFATVRDGRAFVIDNATLLTTPFLDISATSTSDSGSALSVIAFHPDFAVAGSGGEDKFYTLSQEAAGTAPAHFPDAGAVHQSVLYEWRVSAANPNLADMSSRREVLRIDDATTVHNTNDLVFGPDGYLYVAIGDDDLDDDDSLDPTTTDGTILRIDVDDISGNGRYTIPADNPFVGNTEGRPEEVFAWGFRNPWRIAFHPDTGELYAADIGEDEIEEIDIVTAGGYYGWNYKEGSFAFLGFNVGVTDDLTDLPPGFDGIDPLAEYDHTEGDRSITGGFIYRGALIPALAGHYIFGDFVSGRLMHLDPVTNVIAQIAIDPTGDPLNQGIIGFGETEAGEILIVTTGWTFDPTGQVLEVVAGSAPGLLPDGDVNLDGLVDVSDLLLLEQALAQQATLGLAASWHADLHPAGGGDDAVTLGDLLLLEQLLTTP
ncbi:MAG: PQQ-dependent sugar dehydrogenase [Gammaproteobacteria bacterium]